MKTITFLIAIVLTVGTTFIYTEATGGLLFVSIAFYWVLGALLAVIIHNRIEIERDKMFIECAQAEIQRVSDLGRKIQQIKDVFVDMDASHK